jgi:hypothetical protein
VLQNAHSANVCDNNYFTGQRASWHSLVPQATNK